MTTLIDITGMVFSNLTAISLSHYDKRKKPYWLFKCCCGTEKLISKCHVTGNKIKSCGCIRGTHKMSKTPTFKRWKAIKSRCSPKYHRRKDYYDRGIKICDRWNKFENFLEDMGELPGSNYSIDRINNDGNYEPSNCRWATSKQQSFNRRSNCLITFDNKTQPLGLWAIEKKLNPVTLWNRLNSLKWSIDRALTTPVIIPGVKIENQDLIASLTYFERG